MEKFQWLSQGRVGVPTLDFDLVARWIERVAAGHGRLCGPLSYVFCDDETIIDVNRRFLDHDYYTDIITFDDTRGRLIRGDMFISLDTVASNAVMQGVDYERELLRVIIHGVLHLCGINDKGPGERQIMESHEDSALALLDQMAG
ncbi:MAG: rRNA maturation RNase YbeY [Muribaculaceae bacterium]|nr:rRNA maturation RNase YbeY [Muribaculaceae bacterium]